MLRQTLLLLVDIQLLDIENHLLLESVLVERHTFDFSEILLKTCTYLLYTLFLVRLYFCKQRPYTLDAHSEEFPKSFAFLAAKLHKSLKSLIHSLMQSRNVIIGKSVGQLALYSFRKTHKHTIPILGPWNTQCHSHLLNLGLICGHKWKIERYSGLHAYRFGIYLHIDLAALQTR